MTSIADLIERKLRASLAVAELQLFNESHMHSGPATDSHFKLVLVSGEFEGLSLVKRHQRIYQALAPDVLVGQHIHALALHAYTEAEWQTRGKTFDASPNCRGGSKANF